MNANESHLQIPFTSLSLILNGAAEAVKLDVAYLRASPAIGNVCGLCEFSRPPFKYGMISNQFLVLLASWYYRGLGVILYFLHPCSGFWLDPGSPVTAMSFPIQSTYCPFLRAMDVYLIKEFPTVWNRSHLATRISRS